MGVDEKKKRAKHFEQQMDKARTLELEGEDLFSNMPVIVEQQFEGLRDPVDIPLAKGSKARLLDRRNRFDVYVNMVCVGYLLTDAADVRKSLNLQSGSSLAVMAVVAHVSTISPTFTVTVRVKK